MRRWPGIALLPDAGLSSLKAGWGYVACMLAVALLLIPVREMLFEPAVGNFPALASQLVSMTLAMAWANRHAARTGVRLPGWSREVVAVIVALSVLFSAESVDAEPRPAKSLPSIACCGCSD